MKTIEFTSNYGNFAYRMTAEVGEDVNEATTELAKQGLANICYRVAGSAVDKALGIKERKGVEYSEEDGQRVNAAVSAKIDEMLKAEKTKGLAPLKLSFAVTGQHVFGESGEKPTKRATEVWTALQQKPGEEFAKVLVKLGLGEDYTDETGIIAVKRFLANAEAKAFAEAKAKLVADMGALD